MNPAAVELAAGYFRSIGCAVKVAEPMKAHTTFKIGGDADILVTVSTELQLSSALKYIRENGLRMTVLGNGSNMLVSDEGIGGVVLKLDEQFCEVSVTTDGKVRAGAGATLSAMCHAALDAELTGLEFAWGIPGSVGGAAYMNAGAYGGEMKDVVVSVEYITRDGAWDAFSSDECGFDYRMSVFQKQPHIITAVTVQLKPGDKVEIKAQMDDILQRRKSKQPLEMPSAGSVFKRPVGYYAGGLIQQCGLKGASVGGAQVSEKHAGFIVNKGGATCADVLGLVKHIQDTVREQTGVSLECEIRTIS